MFISLLERRTVNERVDITDNEQNPIVSNEHAYSFDNRSSLVPKINFTGRNPFQTGQLGRGQSVQGHSCFENNKSPIKSLGSFRKSREYMRKVIVGDKEVENIPQSCNSSNVPEYGRGKIETEIKTYIDNHNYDSMRKVKNSDILDELKEEFSGMLGSVFSRERSKMENNFCESRKFGISNSSQLRVFEGQAKLQIRVSPILISEAKTLLQANDECTSNKDVFEPMQIDLTGGEAVNLLERNDLLVNREEQHRYGESDRNIQATVYDNSLGNNADQIKFGFTRSEKQRVCFTLF